MIGKDSIKALAKYDGFLTPEGFLKTDLDLSRFSFETGEIITNSMMQAICKSIPGITELNLANCSQISDAGLWTIGNLCGATLQKLNLSYCNNPLLTHIGIRSLTLCCKNLTSLNLSCCDILDDNSAFTLSTGVWELKELILEECNKVGETGILEICKPLGKYLEILNLKNCSKVGDFGNRGLNAIGSNCPNLKILDLTGCRRTENLGLKSIACGCSKLEVLKLGGCHAVSGDAFKFIFVNLSNLKTLELDNCVKLQDKDMKICFDLMSNQNPKLKQNLTSLEICGAESVTDEGLYALCSAIGGNLLYLNISGCAMSDVGSSIIAAYCARLRDLDLSYCEGITDDSVHILSQQVSALCTLKLDGTDGGAVTMTSLMQYVCNPNDINQKRSWDKRSVKGFAVNGNADLASTALARASSKVWFNDSEDRIDSGSGKADKSGKMPPFPPNRSLSSQGKSMGGLFQDSFASPRMSRTMKMYGVNVQIQAPEPMEFAELATSWLGYQPKQGSENMIGHREKFRLETKMALRIQCMVRKKIAFRKYRVKRMWWLVHLIIPKFQASVRGYFRRKQYRAELMELIRQHSATRIQAKWRKYLTRCDFITGNKRRNYEAFLNKMALIIQKFWVGYKGRRFTTLLRNYKANERLLAAKVQAKKEVCSTHIQRVFRGFEGRLERDRRRLQRQREKRRKLLELNMTVCIQRLMRGKIGRLRAERRRRYLARKLLEWKSAWTIERVYRGHVGRLIACEERRLARLRFINLMANNIQRVFRGCRGRIMANVTKAMMLIRANMNKNAMVMQRWARGVMGREHAKHFREKIQLERLQLKSLKIIQRIYRGFKGRECREVEIALRKMEDHVATLNAHVKSLEEEIFDHQRTLNRLEDHVRRLDESIATGNQELKHAVLSNNKYTDSSVINPGVPQRYLTKYLIVRLKDHIDNDEALLKLKSSELFSAKLHMRDLQGKITISRREIIALTAGLIIKTKHERTTRLRNLHRTRRKASIVIQALWRGAVVRYRFAKGFYNADTGPKLLLN